MFKFKLCALKQFICIIIFETNENLYNYQYSLMFHFHQYQDCPLYFLFPWLKILLDFHEELILSPQLLGPHLHSYLSF